MNIFGNWFFSFFMVAGTSFPAPEVTFSVEQENVLEMKEKKSFNYIAGSSSLYPSPSLSLGHRIKNLDHTDDFAIGVSYIPVGMSNATTVPGLPILSGMIPHTKTADYIQGYAHYGYYRNWDFARAYYGPGAGIAVSKSFEYDVWLKPSFTVGKEYETFFHQVDFCVAVPVTNQSEWGPIPTITYEIGVKF